MWSFWAHKVKKIGAFFYCPSIDFLYTIMYSCSWEFGEGSKTVDLSAIHEAKQMLLFGSCFQTPVCICNMIDVVVQFISPLEQFLFGVRSMKPKKIIIKYQILPRYQSQY